MVLKATFGQSPKWSLVGGKFGIELKEKYNLDLENMTFYRGVIFQLVLIMEINCIVYETLCNHYKLQEVWISYKTL